MKLSRPRFLTKKCAHETTLVVRSAGMERIVCEACGHMSFTFLSEETPESTPDHIETRGEGRHKKAS